MREASPGRSITSSIRPCAPAKGQLVASARPRVREPNGGRDYQRIAQGEYRRRREMQPEEDEHRQLSRSERGCVRRARPRGDDFQDQRLCRRKRIRERLGHHQRQRRVLRVGRDRLAQERRLLSDRDVLTEVQLQPAVAQRQWRRQRQPDPDCRRAPVWRRWSADRAQGGPRLRCRHLEEPMVDTDRSGCPDRKRRDPPAGADQPNAEYLEQDVYPGDRERTVQRYPADAHTASGNAIHRRRRRGLGHTNARACHPKRYRIAHRRSHRRCRKSLHHRPRQRRRGEGHRIGSTVDHRR